MTLLPIGDALLGWSLDAQLGRLPARTRGAFEAALALALAWPVAILLLIVAPPRALWLVIVLMLPLAVGIALRGVTRRAWARAAIEGYPLTLGLLAAFATTLVVVPRERSRMRRDHLRAEHAPLEPRNEARVVQDLIDATGASPVAARSIPTRVLEAFALGALTPLTSELPRVLRGEGVELWLFAHDLSARSTAPIVERVLTSPSLASDAWLVDSTAARAIQRELEDVLRILSQRDHPEEIARSARTRLRSIERDIAASSFEDDDARALTLMADALRRRVDALAPEAPPSDLLQRAALEAKELVRLEIELAKNEARGELRAAIGALVAAALALALSLIALAMIAVAAWAALGADPLGALAIAGVLFGAAVLAGVVAYALAPKKPLARATKNIQADLTELRERMT